MNCDLYDQDWDQFSSLCVKDGIYFLGTLGEIRMYDSHSLELLKLVSLDGDDAGYVSCPTKLYLTPDNSIACDYGRQIRVLKFSNKKMF